MSEALYPSVSPYANFVQASLQDAGLPGTPTQRELFAVFENHAGMAAVDLRAHSFPINRIRSANKVGTDENDRPIIDEKTVPYWPLISETNLMGGPLNAAIEETESDYSRGFESADVPYDEAVNRRAPKPHTTLYIVTRTVGVTPWGEVIAAEQVKPRPGHSMGNSWRAMLAILEHDWSKRPVDYDVLFGAEPDSEVVKRAIPERIKEAIAGLAVKAHQEIADGSAALREPDYYNALPVVKPDYAVDTSARKRRRLGRRRTE